MTDLGEIAKHERQRMRVVQAPDLANALRRDGIAELAAKRIARIGRIRDHSVRAQNGSGLADEPRLRIVRMKVKDLGHAASGAAP
jgi:predicted amino acid racemase